MSKLPGTISTTKFVNALQRDGWVVVRRQGGAHIQLRKRLDDEMTSSLTVPYHGRLQRELYAKILKQARISHERFLELL